MIEAVKKRYKIGDIVTIHTSAASFTGVLDAFEDTCVIIITDEGEEFISNEDIKRVSVPKKEGLAPIVTLVIKEQVQNENVEIENQKVENKTQTFEVKSTPPQYKVGDKIPLEVLEERTGKKVKPPKIKGKPSLTLDSLSDLSKLILPELEAENTKIVPANGVIESHFAYKNFGYIRDKFNYKIWFSFNDVIDPSLFAYFKNTSTHAEIPVLFTLSKNYKGDKAINIQKPKTILEVANLAKQYYEEKKPETALGVLDQIFGSFPDNYTATKIKEEIEINRKKTRGFANKAPYKSYDLNYQKATKAKNIDKNFDEALKYYMLALENNEKRESCIKDIAMLYISMGETEKASNFIIKYENELPDNITTYNYLANIFSSLKDFKKVIEYVELLLNERSINNDRRKNSLYLSQKGFALIQLGEIDEAREILEEAVSLQKENTYANRLLKALDEPDSDELSQIIADAEFDSFGGGLSKFISDTLDGYTEYFGVPAKVIDAGDFTHETLNAIRRLIDTAGRARPRERANYLLTEAKLMQTLEPEKDNSLRSVLARHCNAMALNHISENSPMDVIRYYYLEAFSLEENYRFTAKQVAIYLFTFKSSYTDLFSVSTKTPSIEDAISFVLEGDYRENIWEGILSMFLWNRSISAQITSKLCENSNLRDKSLTFLSSIGLTLRTSFQSDEYINLWNQAREKRQRDYSRWLASIKSIYANENIETLANQLYDTLSDAKKPWLTQLDTLRLVTISTDILDVLNQYLRQSGYRDKERFCGFAKQQVYQLISEIKDKPTKFSYEGFIPLLEKIELLLDKSFKSIEAASTPKVKVGILKEANIVGNDSIVPFQVRVENSKDSSPIRDIKLTVQNNEDVTIASTNNEHFDSVDGGEYCIIKLSVKLSDKIVKDKATSLTIQYSYKKRNQEEPVYGQESLSLRLYSEEEFETIPNPYEKLANGGPVTDTGMFYGRNEFIERITDAIISADSKQLVIFGQKRSGKSSVLYHLKKSLENTKRTFCVSFSIGDIFETISTATFFYKILSVIEEELENLSFEGKEIPEFTCPTFADFKENPNPADIFRKHIRSFKRACSVHQEWRDKKLVVMIDEFTYLFTAIKTDKVSDAIMKQWKAITQNEDATFSSVLVGQDVFPMFKDEFPNEFGVTQDERLTYLSKDDAIKLIEVPIWNQKANRNRFIGDAIDTIIDYTSCNPYYIQIFCARLVTEMNRKKYIEVTNADIKEVADSFINGGQALTDDKFDNLLNAGEKHDIQRIPQEHSKSILKQIANNAMNVGFCLREQISIGNVEYEDEILRDLVKREVLEQKGDSYKIQVKLFQEWLLKH